MFQLPKDVEFEKKVMGQNISFEFYHKNLGSLGRIYIEGINANSSILHSEIANSADNDPRKAERELLFAKISTDISNAMPQTMGQKFTPPARQQKVPLREQERIHSKLFLCESCEDSIFNLIYYPAARSHAQIIDVKRKMYSKLEELNVDSYVLAAPDFERNAHVYKVWPEEKDLGFLEPDDLFSMLGRLCKACTCQWNS